MAENFKNTSQINSIRLKLFSSIELKMEKRNENNEISYGKL